MNQYLKNVNFNALKISAFPLLFLSGFLFVANSLQAQRTSAAVAQKRCATMQVLKEKIQQDPTLPEKWRREGEKRQLQFETDISSRSYNILNNQANEIIIPVVFHLVGSNAILNSIPDRDLYEQVEILNRDFNGKKLDGYKGLFAPQLENLVGKIPVKFVLARRTPGGALTSGIERRITTQTFSGNTESALKHFSTGGLDAWDVTKYLNIWVTSFIDGTLGIAMFPFMTPANEQGVAIDLRTLGSNPCRSYLENYNEGSTLSHEVGHYFYLGHAWGDDNGACGNSDFWIQNGWPLPADATDDTPDQAGSSSTLFGNLSGTFNDVCTPAASGIMYMNFMNYYDDRSLFMFSDGQRKRVMGTIDLYRTGLKTTNGHIPPSSVNDVYLVSVTPLGKCDTRAPIVNNTPIKATLRNSGTTNLTSVNFHVSINGGATVTTTWTGVLPAGQDTVINLGPISVGSAGNYTVQVYTTAPNGAADNFLSNDTLTTLVNVLFNTVTAPFSENFSSTTFPPANWSVHNQSGITWIRSGNAGFSAAGSAVVQNYDNNISGQIDELITPPIDLGSNTAALLKFKVAHAAYGNRTDEWDGLEVHISSNGGETYTLAYKKVSNELKTIAGVTGNTAFNPLVDQSKWREETISLNQYIVPGQPVIIKFRNVTAWGNNLYLDDITVAPAIPIDASLSQIQNISSFYCNQSTVSPSITITNTGTTPLSSLVINYQLDNGALVSQNWNGNLGFNQSQVVALNAVNNISTGNHLMTVYITSPNGLDDTNKSNDTLRKTFFNFPVVNAPVVESFESAAFPPAGWAVNNPDGATTWTKTNTAVRKNSPADISSALIRNFTYNATKEKDELITPVINYTNVDSVFLKFDVAASIASGEPSRDTLEILITQDCGASYQSIYRKWGNTLTTTSATSAEFIPADNNEWRTDSIDLLPYLGTSSSFQIVFRNTHTNSGNNIYLDNINIFTENVPVLLKQRGHLILPTAFTSNFLIWHYEQPTDLKYVQIFNSVGQLVWQRQYNTDAGKEIYVNFSGKSAGVYIVNMIYSDPKQNISQRIVKY